MSTIKVLELISTVRKNIQLYSGMKRRIKNRKFISLLSDFGMKDPFVGIMKGVILNINPEAQIVDIIHEIKSHEIFEGAYALLQSYKYFPSGTIHIAVVDPGVGGNRKKLIIKTNSYIFVVPDNGIASLIIEREPAEIFEINNEKYFLKEVSNTFHGRDIFAPVGAFLSLGIRPQKIGKRIDQYEKVNFPKLIFNKNKGIATIIHIDKFGNLTTNIQKGCLTNIKCIYVRGNKIPAISNSYDAGVPGEILAILGSANFLEICINKQSAADKMNLEKGDKIFFDLK